MVNAPTILVPIPILFSITSLLHCYCISTARLEIVQERCYAHCSGAYLPTYIHTYVQTHVHTVWCLSEFVCSDSHLSSLLHGQPGSQCVLWQGSLSIYYLANALSCVHTHSLEIHTSFTGVLCQHWTVVLIPLSIWVGLVWPADTALCCCIQEWSWPGTHLPIVPPTYL